MKQAPEPGGFGSEISTIPPGARKAPDNLVMGVVPCGFGTENRRML